VNLPDPADASVADVRKALDRKFRIYGPSVEVAMSIFGPVLEARDREIARLRDECGQVDTEGSGTWT
jgi:hypothetical protein